MMICYQQRPCISRSNGSVLPSPAHVEGRHCSGKLHGKVKVAKEWLRKYALAEERKERWSLISNDRASEERG